MRVWLDDLREAPSGWLWLTNSRMAINWLEWAKMLNAPPEVWSFDHDLGGDDTSRPVVLWMCENEFWPTQCFVHSANPVGIEWLSGMIDRYGPGVSK
ncbi:hypothetical protein SEA_ANNADREAMY_225 [Streptomyces phage Annadreamy]|uniref:Cyclic-phosphate processing Receiver domain-containing protein n=2 Tax=Annadreamyvirus annadreamy TaxID=2846392 RepID=A0A345GTN7_9CAUD|nr:hypothetical protein HWB75_gp053 [Streptomyces phage Annadreamy]AXG66309.1 hypothetical protein SEA_ANNADREAMY_225 [Streptomyces phage Annadreamy]QGH79533.1 hypothetical protein SEA_LIMPID_232 [Streptomyces phage Limpid]